MFPEAHGFVAMLVTSCIKDSCSNLPLYNYCDRHSNKTVTCRKHVPKYKNITKCTVEFLRKLDNRGIKITGVSSILITKSID